MASFKIVASDVRLPQSRAWLKEVFASGEPELIVLQRASSDELGKAVTDADSLVCGTTNVTGEVIRAGKKLRLIQKVGLRYENIDLEAAKKAGIPVCVARKLGRIQIAEHAFALILALHRKILPAHAAVIRCDYETKGIQPIVADQTHFLPNWFGYSGITTLYGQTLGILGMGEIGSEVALHGKAFGMSMFYYQRHRIDLRAETELGLKYVGFEELVRRADILTVCIPQTPQTEKMISARELSLMKRSSYLINIAKGAIVDEEALAQALQAGALAGAGLDVFGQEPLPKDHPLLRCPNVVLTPHLAMGVAAGGNVEDEIKLTFSHVRRVLEGSKPEERVV